MAEIKNVTINISTGTILKVAGIFLALAFAYFIRDIILMIFIAIIFAALIEPFVNFLEEKKIPRGVSLVGIYVILFLVAALIVRLLIPPIIEQISLLAINFPDFWNQVTDNFTSLQQYSQQQNLTTGMQQGLMSLQSGLKTAASGIYGFIIAVFRSVVNFVVILVITFYLVVQKDAINKMIKAVAPVQHHSYLFSLFATIQKKIGDWARGQLILGLAVGVLVFIGLFFILPKYALVLALVAGITEIIPYLGPILAGIPAVFLGFAVPPISLWRGLAVLILFIVVQQAENNIITPQVMKRQVGLNPVVVIIVMLIGAKLAGIIGLILAIPVATSVSIIAKDFMARSEPPKIKGKSDMEKAGDNNIES